MSATAAGIVATSEVVFAFLFAWAWLRETLDLVQIAGAAVVVAGILLAQTSRANVALDADLAIGTGSVPNPDLPPTPQSNTSSKNVGGVA